MLRKLIFVKMLLNSFEDPILSNVHLHAGPAVRLQQSVQRLLPQAQRDAGYLEKNLPPNLPAVISRDAGCNHSELTEAQNFLHSNSIILTVKSTEEGWSFHTYFA